MAGPEHEDVDAALAGIEESTELRLKGVVGGPSVAGATIRALAAFAGISPRRLSGLRAIVEELVIEAGSRPTAVEGDDVTVRTTIHHGVFEVEVIDKALPVSPDDQGNERSRSLAELGYVDGLEVEACGKEGNAARVHVLLDPKRLGAASGLVERIVPEDAPPVTDEEADAVEIRPMEPGDAVELVRCVYRCYGYSYIDPLLYDPRGLQRALANGEMLSVVAAAPDGTIAGHSAVWPDEPGDTVPEAGRLVVDPRYRGRGLAGRMAEVRLESARDEGYYGIWAEAVTNHVASQREVVAFGGAEVGVLIGAAVPTTMAGFEAAAGDGGEQGPAKRRSLLAMYTPLHPHHEQIYVPERHAELIAELAGRLGIERTQDPGSGAEGGTTSDVTSAAHTFSSLGEIRIRSIGADLLEQIAAALESLEGFDLASILLDLPLADPGAPAAAETLERIGFSYAAWMPSFDDGHDVLRLQRVGSRPVDIETIECARPEGEQVRDYVIADWHRIRLGTPG